MSEELNQSAKDLASLLVHYDFDLDDTRLLLQLIRRRSLSYEKLKETISTLSARNEALKSKLADAKALLDGLSLEHGIQTADIPLFQEIDQVLAQEPSDEG